ncbi:MAG: hypothetical protein AAB719_02170 [Patescibacteria group bacterium]
MGHYYGDHVRSLLVAAAVLMTVTTPFFIDLIHKPIFFAILAMLVLVILSGLINPKQRGLVAVTTITSAVSFLVFEYYAITSFKEFGLKNLFFWVNETIALLCLLATYFGTKSVRGLSQQ